ncbi:MAG TPA: TetR/AcrR family transcriptional regulator [Burkholderiales bacterium]|nr:TetR/AcrR family transcriptional regulator [Burkholderiales bacterium]
MARPIRYNRTEVLEKAMLAFWEKGYHATSMADLVEVTDLRPGSIYAAFRCKEDFYLNTLDHYVEQGISKLESVISGASSPLEGIREALLWIAEDSADPDSKRSCFLVNTVLELARRNEEVGNRSKRHLDAIESLFKKAVEAGQAQGEIPPEKDAGNLAALIMCSMCGLRVLGGASPARSKTVAIAKQVLSALA